MSGIAGIIHFNGAPIEPGQIESMTAAMAHRGPDGIHHWVRGNVALGQCMLRTTPESLEETQPLANEDESLVLVMDGRVDNWEELRRELLGRGAVLRTRADAELVLRAYEVWGEACPDRIVGDFAYAIWDSRQRRLFCARDVMGVKPFHYYEGNGFFLFASELHGLFSDARVPREANLGMVAEYLAAEIVTREETLFKGIRRLAPGHKLSVREGRAAIDSYWNPDLLSVLSYSTEAQYVEHLIEIFKQSMHSKMRSITPVGVRMSGGLDSTTVFAMARSMMRAGETPAVVNDTFSTVFPGEDCDETDYIRLVNDFWGTEGSLVKRWIAPPQHYIDHARRYLDCPDSPNGAMNFPLKERVRSKGIRVLLTGCGGDEWFWGRYSLYADLTRSLRFHELAKLWMTEQGNDRTKSRLYLRYGIFPLLPRSVQDAIRQVRGRRRAFPWITPELLRESCLQDRIATSGTSKIRYATHDQEEVHRVGTNAWMVANAEIEDLTSSQFGFEQRHPLWDRRIIEFALAIPGTLRWRPPYHKYILRQAAAGLLPEAVRLRQDKTLFNGVFSSALAMQGGETRIGSLDLTKIGWVDAEAALTMTRTVLSANSTHAIPGWERHIWPVWMAYSMDVWLRESGLMPSVRI
ncbi:MAG: asparagine synthase (glutamine-hydrolyzing) [Anderseniella sp.]|jgi:asparagine synthase (glutamine-hydrolysing)|nr:asparagine synthase (glutamine-hydrolyzing) [Anderseniella sp.]